MLQLFGGVLAVAGVLFSGMHGEHGSTTPKMIVRHASVENHDTSLSTKHMMNDREGKADGVIGTVSAVSGSTITVSVRTHMASSTPTLFTVDATNAKIFKGSATSSVSDILVGDRVAVKGEVSGTSVTAKVIRDGGVPPPPSIKRETRSLEGKHPFKNKMKEHHSTSTDQ